MAESRSKIRASGELQDVQRKLEEPEIEQPWVF